MSNPNTSHGQGGPSHSGGTASATTEEPTTVEEETEAAEGGRAPAQWDAEPEDGNRADDRQVDEGDDRDRNRLAEDQLTGCERAHHQLLECAELALANDCE